MSLYAITVLNNLNIMSFVTLFSSIPIIAISFIHPVIGKIQRRLLFLLGVSMVVFSLLWIVFAPNSTLLKEWAMEYGYNEISIPCLTCVH